MRSTRPDFRQPVASPSTRSAQSGRRLRNGIVGLILLAPSACDRPDPAGRERVLERDQLRREVAGLQMLDDLAPGQLMDREHEVLVSVRDTLMQSLLSATLPVSVDIRNNLTVTLTAATITFRSNVVRVALTGSVRRRSYPRVTAVVKLRGAFDAFRVDSTHGLRARIAIDDVELDTPGGTLSALDPVVIEVLQRVVEGSMPELAAAIPAVTIPVRLDQRMSLPGFGPEGALSIEPSAAPLRVQAARVIAYQNRLWIVLRVELGQFATVPRSATP